MNAIKIFSMGVLVTNYLKKNYEWGKGERKMRMWAKGWKEETRSSLWVFLVPLSFYLP